MIEILEQELFFAALEVIAIFKSQLLWGALLGALFTHIANRLKSQRTARERQSIAAIQIAIQLRSWLSRTANSIGQTKLHDDSGGRAGNPHATNYKFSFEDELDVVSQLNNSDALKVFQLIEERRSIASEVSITAEMVGHEEGSDLKRGRLAELYMQALPIYQSLSKQAKWREMPSSEDEVELMQKEIEKMLASRERDRKAAAELFS